MKRLFFALIFISAMIITLSACGHEHSYGEWETKKEATCTEEGQKERACECGEKETASIKKVEHTAVTISEIKPTCTETGYSQGEKCSVCEAVIKEPTLLPAAHGYVPKVIATPGCESEGSTLYTCAACDASYTETIDPLGHNYTGASCVSAQKCKNCSSISGFALGHTTAMGTCARCNSFIYPTVVLPVFPLQVSNGEVLNKTVLEITDLKFRFSTSAVIFTFSAKKISDSGFIESGKNFCGFSYTLYDKNGNVIVRDKYAINNLATGESVNDRTITISLPDKISDAYILEISNYSTK